MIFFIVRELNQGGAAKRVLMWQSIIGLERFKIYEICNKKQSNFSNYRYINKLFSCALFRSLNLIRQVKIFGITTICTNNRKYYLLCKFISIVHPKVRYLTTVQLEYSKPLPFERFLHGDKVLAVSQSVNNYLIESVGLASIRIEVIKNTSLPINRKKPAEIVSLRRDYGFENLIVFTCIARYDRVKRHDLVVELFHELCKQTSNIKLVLMGYGELKHEILSLVQIKNLQKKVLFLPPNHSVTEILNCTDISVLLSEREGLSTFLLESISLGIPLIVSNIKSNTEIAIDGFNGVSLDINPLKINYSTILNIVENSDVRKKMGENSYDLYKSDFNIDSYNSQIQRFYCLKT